MNVLPFRRADQVSTMEEMRDCFRRTAIAAMVWDAMHPGDIFPFSSDDDEVMRAYVKAGEIFDYCRAADARPAEPV